MKTYFKPKANVPYERHVFRQSSQKEDETVEQYATRLKKLALTCEFGDTKEDAIRDQIIDKCKSYDLRRRFLREKDLKLDKLLDIGRSYEAAGMCAAKMESKSSSDVNKLKTELRKPTVTRKSTETYKRQEGRKPLETNRRQGQYFVHGVVVLDTHASVV